jgi:hypothetical protein
MGVKACHSGERKNRPECATRCGGRYVGLNRRQQQEDGVIGVMTVPGIVLLSIYWCGDQIKD